MRDAALCHEQQSIERYITDQSSENKRVGT